MVLRNKVNGHVMFNHQMNEWTWLKDKGVDESEKKKKKKKNSGLGMHYIMWPCGNQ